MLFLRDGTPVIKFVGVESAMQTNGGLKNAIETAFNRLVISCFHNPLVGLNLDGASVNMAYMLAWEPRFVKQHPFNHCIELAMKDVFDASAFSKIDQIYFFKKAYRFKHEIENVRY